MTKLQKLERAVGQRVAESVGATRNAAPRVAPPPAEARPRVTLDDRTFRVPLDAIEADPDQPRKEFADEAIAELAASLKERGQLQACLVRPGKEKGRYVLVCGERRLRAARLAGIEALLCRVEAGRSPAELLADQLVENCQRADMNPVELSDGLHRLVKEFGWTTREAAERIGISQPTVSRSLALQGLADEVRQRVRDGRLAPSTAVEIGRVKDHGRQEQLARAAVLSGLSRDRVGDLVEAELAGVLAIDPIGDRVIHGESPISDRVIHGDSGETESVGPTAAAPGPSLVGPVATETGAAASAPRSKVVVWGTDVDQGTVTVELAPGYGRAAIAAALRNALAAIAAEETGADRFEVGDRVKLIEKDHPDFGREGVVERTTFGGLLTCRVTNHAAQRTTIWDCKPANLERLPTPGKARPRGGRS